MMMMMMMLMTIVCVWAKGYSACQNALMEDMLEMIEQYTLRYQTPRQTRQHHRVPDNAGFRSGDNYRAGHQMVDIVVVLVHCRQDEESEEDHRKIRHVQRRTSYREVGGRYFFNHGHAIHAVLALWAMSVDGYQNCHAHHTHHHKQPTCQYVESEVQSRLFYMASYRSEVGEECAKYDATWSEAERRRGTKTTLILVEERTVVIIVILLIICFVLYLLFHQTHLLILIRVRITVRR
mmetsp:Transcript_18182/g.36673  ORF Transcript_18182/g.36673 Transcript_18182/m.36673 type:complete len:236 (-) Transcript_18182:176-883(-)